MVTQNTHYRPMFITMERGVTLLELALALAVAGFMLALSVPKLGRVLDHIATEAAARDVASALASAREAARDLGRRVRVRVTPDTVFLDTLGTVAWAAWRTRQGPAARGVLLTTSNPMVTFAPNGLTWGVSNSSMTFRRGSQVETLVISRVGRIRRA
jgi:Tfp pilus assembly protein FimT